MSLFVVYRRSSKGAKRTRNESNCIQTPPVKTSICCGCLSLAKENYHYPEFVDCILTTNEGVDDECTPVSTYLITAVVLLYTAT